MGFFSWKTSDTKESIPAEASGRLMRTVYLLQPNGLPPISEPYYQGYGVFGGVDVYHWLPRMNAQALDLDLSNVDEDTLRSIGIQMDVGHVFKDTETGKIWHIYHDSRALIDGEYFAGSFVDFIPELNGSANQLIGNGRLKQFAISDLVDWPYKLKFSFSKDAVYEDLPPSENCPDQGYFYED